MSREKEIRSFMEDWDRKVVKQAISRQKERKERFQTASGIEVKPLYTPLDLEEIGFDYVRDLGFPGRYPFTRGKDPLGYRQNLWTFRQYSGYGDAQEANKRYRFLLEQGANALSIALDLPTQMGYDSDHPLAKGEVGKVGVAIDSLQDMETLFKDIPFEKVRSVGTVANAIPSIWLAMLLVWAEKNGVSTQNFVGRIQNDILKEFYAKGSYIFPPKESVGITTDVIAYCAEHYPHWIPCGVCGYHLSEAGANAAQEIGFTIASAITYIDETINKGLKPEKFISKLYVFLSNGMDFFEGIAKSRAMRRLWARTFNQRYSISDPSLLSFHRSGFTAGSSLTAQQPMNNIIRVAIESLAAVLGGCDFLHACSMDEALGTPTEESVKLSLRTQQIIAYETGVDQVVDPLAGSYFVEYLTTKLEAMAEEYLNKVLEIGGAIRAIETGYFQQQISRSAYELQREIEEGKRIIVGVNQYMDKEELPIKILKVAPAFERKQKEKLKKLRRERNHLEVRETLKELKHAAENCESLIPSLIRTVRAYTTVGEMCDTLREVYGEYTPGHYF